MSANKKSFLRIEFFLTYHKVTFVLIIYYNYIWILLSNFIMIKNVAFYSILDIFRVKPLFKLQILVFDIII